MSRSNQIGEDRWIAGRAEKWHSSIEGSDLWQVSNNQDGFTMVRRGVGNTYVYYVTGVRRSQSEGLRRYGYIVVQEGQAERDGQQQRRCDNGEARDEKQKMKGWRLIDERAPAFAQRLAEAFARRRALA